MFKKITKILYFILILFQACEPPPRNNSSENIIDESKEKYITSDVKSSDEEYLMVTTAINLPLYVNHDQAAFLAWGKKMGVKTTILGPSEWDVAAQISTIEQVIPTRPAGLLINGTDPAIAQSINKAVEAGIPTIVYDSEVSGCLRNCFIGSNWYEMGKIQGENLAHLIHGKGKVACMGILGMENIESGFQGFQDALKKYPDIIFIGKYNDKANVEVAAKITADLIAANPDLSGIGGFDSNSGPGMGLSVLESGKKGIIKLTCVDAEPEHLKLVREGVIDMLVAQKRELFTSLGAQFLYDMRHRTWKFSKNDSRAGIIPIPDKIFTGVITIDKNNIDLF